MHTSNLEGNNLLDGQWFSLEREADKGSKWQCLDAFSTLKTT